MHSLKVKQAVLKLHRNSNNLDKKINLCKLDYLNCKINIINQNKSMIRLRYDRKINS